MLVQRAYVYRLEPTVEQETFLAQVSGACRFVFNCALEQRRDWYRKTKLSYFQQARELTDCRAAFDWLAACPVHALQCALRDVDNAFQRFFSGIGGYPRPRRKEDGHGFRLPDPAYLGFKRLNRSKGAIRIPKVGWIKLRGYRPLGGELRNITISKRGAHWCAAITWRADVADPDPSTSAPVGIDRGVAIFAACSTGKNHVAPVFFKRIEIKLANAQRVLARRVKGSARWRKQKARITKLHSIAANARRDFLHKTSLTIAKNHGMVAIEKLQVKNMSRSAKGTMAEPGKNVEQKAGLNRSILDKGWGIFRSLLAYKLADRGGTLVEVDPAYTSQTCSACGHVSKQNRKSQSDFECIKCGHVANADTNAAINILNKAVGHTVSARGSSDISRRNRELPQMSTAYVD